MNNPKEQQFKKGLQPYENSNFKVFKVYQAQQPQSKAQANGGYVPDPEKPYLNSEINQDDIKFTPDKPMFKKFRPDLKQFIDIRKGLTYTQPHIIPNYEEKFDHYKEQLQQQHAQNQIQFYQPQVSQQKYESISSSKNNQGISNQQSLYTIYEDQLKEDKFSNSIDSFRYFNKNPVKIGNRIVFVDKFENDCQKNMNNNIKQIVGKQKPYESAQLYIKNQRLHELNQNIRKVENPEYYQEGLEKNQLKPKIQQNDYKSKPTHQRQYSGYSNSSKKRETLTKKRPEEELNNSRVKTQNSVLQNQIKLDHDLVHDRSNMNLKYDTSSLNKENTLLKCSDCINTRQKYKSYLKGKPSEKERFQTEMENSNHTFLDEVYQEKSKYEMRQSLSERMDRNDKNTMNLLKFLRVHKDSRQMDKD